MCAYSIKNPDKMSLKIDKNIVSVHRGQSVISKRHKNVDEWDLPWHLSSHIYILEICLIVHSMWDFIILVFFRNLILSEF